VPAHPPTNSSRATEQMPSHFFIFSFFPNRRIVADSFRRRLAMFDQMAVRRYSLACDHNYTMGGGALQKQKLEKKARVRLYDLREPSSPVKGKG